MCGRLDKRLEHAAIIGEADDDFTADLFGETIVVAEEYDVPWDEAVEAVKDARTSLQPAGLALSDWREAQED